MDVLIQLVLAIVIFAVIGYGLYWVCTKFFPSFPPALWICGAILLIGVILFASRILGGGTTWSLHGH